MAVVTVSKSLWRGKGRVSVSWEGLTGGVGLRTKLNAISRGCGRHGLKWVAQTPDKGGLASPLVANDDERASTGGGLAAVVLGDVGVDGGVVVGKLRREASEGEGSGGVFEARVPPFEPLVGWAFQGSSEEGSNSCVRKVVV